MPKQADIRVQVPGCTAARFWDVVYENPEATEKYHTSFNLSTETSVSPWDSCQRTVSFTMPLKMPDFIKKMVGLDCVAVTEVQRVVWHGGGSFTVTSETAISNLIGAGRFVTALQLNATEMQSPAPSSSATATSADDSGPGGYSGGSGSEDAVLQLVYGVRCAASGIPWPMSATIENIMAEKALVSMQSFLDHCTQLLHERDMREAAAAGAVNDAAGPTGHEPAAAGAAANGGKVAAEPLPVAVVAASGGTQGSAAAATSPAPVAAPGHLTSAGAHRPAALRHRWPSITCSHDIVGPGGGAGSFLRRQDTLGGLDEFWDAPESFVAAGGPSGTSSGVVSPRQTLQPSALLRRLSGDHLHYSAAANSAGTQGGAGAAHGGSGSSGPCGPAAGIGAAQAGGSETNHQVVLAVDRLAAAVTSLDSKLEAVLRLQRQQEERHQQLQQEVRQLTNRNSNSTATASGTTGTAAASPPPAAGVGRSGRGAWGGTAGGGGRRGGDSGAGSDVRWLLRIVIALLLATCFLLSFWMLRPYTTGFRPHGGGGASGGGAGPSPDLLHQASVIRLRGSGLGDGGGEGAVAGAGGGHQSRAATGGVGLAGVSSAFVRTSSRRSLRSKSGNILRSDEGTGLNGRDELEGGTQGRLGDTSRGAIRSERRVGWGKAGVVQRRR